MRYRIWSYGPSKAVSDACNCSQRKRVQTFLPAVHDEGCDWLSTPWRWEPMGPSAPWQNRHTELEAATKAFEWTGGLGVPAMRVTDTEAGDTVVWQYDHPESYNTPCPLDLPGPNVLPPWHAQVRATVLGERATADDVLDLVNLTLEGSTPCP